MVERGCWVARRIADRIEAAPGATVLNDVVLNQVLVRFETDDRDPAASDALTRATLQAIQDEGTIWLSGTTWHEHGGHPGLGLELGDRGGRGRAGGRDDPRRRRPGPGEGHAGGLTHRLRPRRSAADPPGPPQTAPHRP